VRGRGGGLRVTIACLGVLAMAPTPGDVGGCGSEAELLEPSSYEATRKRQDCQRCEECSVTTERCARACDPAKPSDIVVPPSCLPLLRDGQVCIRALVAASCTDFATYVDDVAPRTPSECQFCRQGTSP
jgi:hypothetical protein